MLAATGKLIFSANRPMMPAVSRDCSRMARRSAAALILLLEGLRRAGEDVAPVLQRYGLDAARLDPHALLDRDLERRLHVEIAGSLRNPLAGLEAGASLGIGSYGPFTLLLLTADHVLAAMQAAVEFQSLSFLSSRLAVEPGRTRTALVLVPDPLPAPAYRFRVDLEVAATCKLLRELERTAQVDTQPARIVMPYPEPPEAAEYPARLGCRVAWAGSRTRLEIDNERLRQRFATADPGAHRIVRAQCRRQRVDLERQEDGVAARIESHLATSAGPYPGIRETAAVLGRSERTLRRQLHAEGTSYRRVLERVPVEAIALELGYSEPAAFIHAFRRWTGTTPAAWRRGGTGKPVA
jgi:AraC-like DNA-binding protein